MSTRSRKRARPIDGPIESTGEFTIEFTGESAGESVSLKVGNDADDKLRTGMAQLWRDKVLCDVFVNVEGRSFAAHRLVLAAASSYMKACLAGHFSESSRPSINLPDTSADAFAAALHFIYEQAVQVHEDLLTTLLEVARRLDLEALQVAVQGAIAERLTPANCLDAWDLADSLSVGPLKAEAKSVALSKFDEVVESPALMKLSADKLSELLSDNLLVAKTEDVVFSALEAWVDAQKPPPAEGVEAELLGHVRVAHMQARDRLERSPLVQRHPMVLLSAYREIIDKVETARSRFRTFSVPPLTFDDFSKGMRVRVKDDLAFVEKECKATPPGATDKVGWNSGMSKAIGEVFKVVRRTDRGLMAAKLETKGQSGMASDYLFPYTTLERVVV